jgi:hypothetical protein
VDPDVVGSPQGAEEVAAGGQLADEVGEYPVVGGAAGFGAQQGDDLAGVALPVAVEGLRARVEEGEPRRVHRPLRHHEHLAEQGSAEPVGGHRVEAAVLNEHGHVVHGVDQLQHAGADLL